MDSWFWLALPLAALLALVILVYRLWPAAGASQLDARLQAIEQQLSELPRLQNLAAVIASLESLSRSQQQLPIQVLRCIQGNINTLKGQAAELVAYLQLNATYDRLLPFNSITDFIGIKFPHGDDPGRLDFIDIKTGSARLSPEQTKLRRIIESKQINFVKIRVTTDLPSSSSEDSECVSM